MSTSDQQHDPADAQQGDATPDGPAAPVPPDSTGGRDELAANRLRNQMSPNQAGDDDSDVEEELWTGGYSSKAMVGTWILLAMASVGLLVVPFFVEGSFLVVLGVIAVIWIIGGCVYARRRLGVHYLLTNQRFVHQTGILTRRTDRIEVIDIDDVTCTQGLIERVFGVGTIVITGSDRTHPTLSMIGISDCKNVAALIDDVRRKERRRRSLHIEAI